MREKLKAGYYLLLDALGRDAWLLERIKREKLLVVLNLHQVSPHENPFWPPLHPKIFDGLLEFLKAHFEIVLLVTRRRQKTRSLLRYFLSMMGIIILSNMQCRSWKNTA